MSKCIVVEGPDGSGKSTLLKMLEKQLGVEAKHGGGPPKTEAELRQRLEIDPDAALMDRWSAISDQIYATVLRGETMIPVGEMMQYILNERPHIIYCRPPCSVLEENLSALDNTKAHKPKEHCDQVRKEYWRIVKAYDTLMKQLIDKGLLVTIYDYTGKKIHEYS